VAPDGTISAFAGTGAAGFSGDGGPAVAARLRGPVGLAVDARGDVFIGDRDGDRVREVTPDGRIRTFAGTGTPGSAGDGGPARSATMSPYALAAGGAGHLFVADSQVGVVRRIGPEPGLTTGPLLWTAVGGKVMCGLSYFPREILCVSAHVPPPRPDPYPEGDSGFVFLKRTGRPQRARLSQNTWIGSGAIAPVKMRGTWRVRGTPIVCSAGARSVRCRNAHHGFTITRRAYRAF
jgi:hypothetical protein